MLKIGFILVVFSFGWYLTDVVYGKQQSIPPANSSAHNSSAHNSSVHNSSVQREKLSSIPELTEERIELLRRIAGLANKNELSYVNASAETGSSDDPITLSGVAAMPAEFDAEINRRSADSEWKSYRGIDQKSNTKEGLASSGWTTLSPSLNTPDENIQAALVAICNDNGARSLYIRMLSSYPGTEPASHVNVVNGQIGWDSASSYDAPFTYDVELNALRLRAGVKDAFSMIKAGNKVTIQIPWQDNNQATFEFSLNGSSQALKTAFDYCGSVATN